MKLVICQPAGEGGLKNKNWAGGIGAHNLITCQLRWSLGALPNHRLLTSTGVKEGTMSDVEEKLIVKLGQRINEQNEILRMIAASLEGVESHLRQIAFSSNPAPNYQRPLSEYPTFDWPSIGATVLNRDDDGVTAVEWNSQVFTRRSPNNKFDAAVWFSRHLGQDSDGCDLKHRMAVTATGCFQNSTAIGCFLAP
jgi:ssDNA-binding DdrB-like protein